MANLIRFALSRRLAHRSLAGALIAIHKRQRYTVIPAWIPESSHRDVNLSIGTELRSSSGKAVKLPSMALDPATAPCVALPPASMQSTGIHAGMTTETHFYSSHVPAWEFSPQRSSVAGRWSVYHCIPTPERGNDDRRQWRRCAQSKLSGLGSGE